MQDQQDIANWFTKQSHTIHNHYTWNGETWDKVEGEWVMTSYDTHWRDWIDQRNTKIKEGNYA